MALTKDVIKANASLANLSDEQIATITTLSMNDENTVIGKRIGEMYRDLDRTIAEATGIDREGDEKTYKYLERAAKLLKEQAGSVDGLNKQIAELTKDKTRLEKIVAEGSGDAEAKKALAQAQKDLAAVTKQYNDLKADHDKAISSHAKELFGLRLDNELSVAVSGLKFKPEFPQSVTEVILGNALAKVKGMNPEYVDDGKGGKVLAFKDETGALKRNPEKQLELYSATDLVANELRAMGVLDEGRQQTGGGTGNGGNGGRPAMTLSGAKTRVEAQEIITQQLINKGLDIGSDQFEAEMTQAWRDNNIASLPER